MPGDVETAGVKSFPIVGRDGYPEKRASDGYPEKRASVLGAWACAGCQTQRWGWQNSLGCV